VQSAPARTAPPKPAVPALEEPPTESVSAESAEEFLRKAREAAASKRYAEAVGILDEFLAASPRLNAEAWWLYGQCLEAASPARDIKRALAAYTALTRQFPASGRYRAALNRIAYLDKFYFSIN
jgi:tetratricopeptide (TPR) repeat protein